MSLDVQPEPTPSLLAGRRKWAILGAGILLVVAGLAVVVRPKTTPTATVNFATNTTTGGTTVNSNPSFRQVTVPLVADADKDGLTDDREAQLKTNPKLADSDGDQLSDNDEVTVYATDPLKQDTDGDGFPDGEEVRSGNNPAGPGKILNLPQSISNINAQ